MNKSEIDLFQEQIDMHFCEIQKYVNEFKGLSEQNKSDIITLCMDCNDKINKIANYNENLKLKYIIEPSNRLYELDFVNGKNLEDGFLARLRPMYLDFDDPVFKLKGTKFELNEGIKFKGVLLQKPYIEVTIHVGAEEFSHDDIMKVDKYMERLRNPFKF